MQSLPENFLLCDRYEIVRKQGESENAITYLARDLLRNDLVAVKEFIPSDALRSDLGVITLPERAHDRRLRILTDARRLQPLRSPHSAGIRAYFGENGTAYRVAPFFWGAEPFPAEPKLAVVLRLLAAVEEVHDWGYIHGNISPSNVVLHQGRIVLLDALSPLAWERQAVAAPEMEDVAARTRVATDIFLLAQMLQDLGMALPEAAQRALDKNPGRRPQNIAELRELLLFVPTVRKLTPVKIDDLLTRAEDLKFARRSCPACEGVLSSPRPLSDRACPICREGAVRDRNFEERLCPVCRIAKLSKLENSAPLRVCPVCRTGVFTFRKRGLLRREITASCPDCFATFDVSGTGMTLVETTGDQVSSRPFADWRRESQRTEQIMHCHECQALFDILSDDRWRQIRPIPEQGKVAFYEDEWLRIAHGFAPFAGNAACDRCGAEFNRSKSEMTVISAPIDPYGFYARYAGRPLNPDQARWLGVGKSSMSSGLVCDSCDLEFDISQEEYLLVESADPILMRHTGETHSLEDWHRIANECPTRDRERDLELEFAETLVEQYRQGEISLFEQSPEIWRGKAVDESGTTLHFVVDDREIILGTMLRRRRYAHADVEVVEVAPGTLTIRNGNREHRLEVAPIVMMRRWNRRKWSVRLEAEDLAARLWFERDRSASSQAFL